MQSMSSQEFNQDVSNAKQATGQGPVFIIEEGVPTHVLLTIEDYYKLMASTKSVAELLSMPEAAEIEFEPIRIKNVSPRM